MQAHIFLGRELFTETVTYAIVDQEGRALLVALHAYRQWEQAALFTKQEIAYKQSQLAFQSVLLD